MTTTRSQVIKLAAFLLVAATLVVGVLALFSGLPTWQKRDRYYVRVHGTAFGVSPGSAALVRGARAGVVTRVEPTTRGFSGSLLVVDIDPGIVVKRSDRAYLQMKGFLGDKQLDIYGGRPDDQALRPGSYIRQGETLLDRLSDRALALASAASSVASTAQHLMTSLSSVSNAIDSSTVRGTLLQVDQTLERFDAAGAQLEDLIAEEREPLRRATTGVGAVLDEAAQALEGFRKTGEELKNVMTRMNDTTAALEDIVRNNGQQLQETLRNLHEASVNANRLSRELREEPSRMVFGQAPEERKLP